MPLVEFYFVAAFVKWFLKIGCYESLFEVKTDFSTKNGGALKYSCKINTQVT